MNHLLRSLAPITDSTWSVLDQEATDHLLPALGARRLVDFSGPHGWQHSATNLGRTTQLTADLPEGVTVAQRRVLPLVELRAGFRVARAELADVERGAVDVSLDDLDSAARRIALAENTAVFAGLESAGMIGIAETSSHSPIPLGSDCARYPAQVAKAAEALAGVGHRRPIRDRTLAGRLHEGRRNDRTRRLPPLRAPRPHPRRSDRSRARGRRSGRAQPPRRRLPLRVRTGHLHRVRAV